MCPIKTRLEVNKSLVKKYLFSTKWVSFWLNPIHELAISQLGFVYLVWSCIIQLEREEPQGHMFASNEYLQKHQQTK